MWLAADLQRVTLCRYVKGWDRIAQDNNPDISIERVMCPTPDANIHLGVMQFAGERLFIKVRCW